MEFTSRIGRDQRGQTLTTGEGFFGKVFISGLPHPFEFSRLQESLFGFSPIPYGIEIAGNQTLSKSRGCIVLNVYDHDTYIRLLRGKQFSYEGRTLLVKPYTTGATLAKMSHHVNQRKVIIKKVPIDTKEEVLAHAIRNQFGPIEVMFQFKRQKNPIKKKSPGRFKSFSVLMQAFEDAKVMADLGTVSLPYGIQASIIPFDPNFGGLKLQTKSEHERHENYQESSKLWIKSNSTAEGQALDFSKSGVIKLKANAIINNLKRDCQLKQGSQLLPLQTNEDIAQKSSPKLSTSPTATFFKPTSSAYYRARNRSQEVTESRLNLPHDIDNIRFNVLLP